MRCKFEMPQGIGNSGCLRRITGHVGAGVRPVDSDASSIRGSVAARTCTAGNGESLGHHQGRGAVEIAVMRKAQLEVGN